MAHETHERHEIKPNWLLGPKTFVSFVPFVGRSLRGRMMTEIHEEAEFEAAGMQITQSKHP